MKRSPCWALTGAAHKRSPAKTGAAIRPKAENGKDKSISAATSRAAPVKHHGRRSFP